MGFTKQPNRWACGPSALRHALITLGVFADERKIARIAGTTRRGGTDEEQMRRAARVFRCELGIVRRQDPAQARRALARFLRRGLPALLCVHEWGHWIAVVKQEPGRYVVVDSEEDPALRLLTWPQLRSRWVYHERDGKTVRPLYDLHPLMPRFRVRSRAKLSAARVKYLRRPENRALAELWDEVVEDLTEICMFRTPRAENVLSMGEFLRRHAQMILDQVDHWHGSVHRPAARRLLDHMNFVADTLGMVIHSDDERRAIAGITAILALWASARYGQATVYEPPAKRGRG